MSERFLIQAGAMYWVKLDDTLLRVHAVQPVEGEPGWWLCSSCRSGIEFAIPEAAFCAKTED